MVRRILLLLCLLLVVAGCGLQPTAKQENTAVLYSVKDASGTELSFRKKPQRIVSLNVSIDEAVLELVPSDRLAALSVLADDPGICSAGAKVKQVAGRAQTTNLEAVLALQPDLVLMPDYAPEALRGLRSAGVQVYVCHIPGRLSEVGAFLRELGAVTGEPERGDKLAIELQQGLERVRVRAEAASAGKPLSVVAFSFYGPLGMQGTFNDVCYYAGVRNALAQVELPFNSQLSQEKLLELDPGLIITPSWDYSGKGDPEQFRQRLLQEPAYKQLQAIRSGRVVRLHDNYLYSTSQYCLLAVEELARAAYPEAFAQESPK